LPSFRETSPEGEGNPEARKLPSEGESMPKFEYKSIKCHLGWSGAEYSIQNWDDQGPNAEKLGQQGWELVGFWPNPVPYIMESHDAKEASMIQIAFFKRQIE
jgi:hypothetical protein